MFCSSRAQAVSPRGSTLCLLPQQGVLGCLWVLPSSPGALSLHCSYTQGFEKGFMDQSRGLHTDSEHRAL